MRSTEGPKIDVQMETGQESKYLPQ